MQGDRAYTVKELDQLRTAVMSKLISGRYGWKRGLVTTEAVWQKPETLRQCEYMLRTHMLAGHTAEDLRASEPPEPDR